MIEPKRVDMFNAHGLECEVWLISDSLISYGFVGFVEDETEWFPVPLFETSPIKVVYHNCGPVRGFIYGQGPLKGLNDIERTRRRCEWYARWLAVGNEPAILRGW